MNRARYPSDWEAFSKRIRYGRAGAQCECMGECGLHGRSTLHRHPRRCLEQQGKPAKWARGKIVLTVAHLNAKGGPCRCVPLCALPEHVKAMCQRCHLRYDHELHQLNASDTRDRKRGQLRLPLGKETS